MFALWGRVMGMEETNARLHEQVTQQAEGLSVLENSHLGTYLFYFFIMLVSSFSLLLSLSPFFQSWAERWSH